MKRIIINPTGFQLPVILTNGNHSYSVCIVPGGKCELEDGYNVSPESKAKFPKLIVQEIEDVKEEAVEVATEPEAPTATGEDDIKDIVKPNATPAKKGDK